MSFIQAKPSATHDFYGPVHKGLRLAQSLMLARLGACDGQDPEALGALLGDLVGLLYIAEHHLENEDKWVHTALEARAPGSTVRLAQSHQRHRQSFEELEALIGQAETARPAARPALLKQLYLAYSLFMAEDFAHMAEEEQLMLPILQSLFTDEELANIEDRIVNAIPPEQKMAFGRFMIPAATRAERIRMMEAIRANAPAEAFDALMEHAARPSLSAEDYDHLRQGLGLERSKARQEADLRWGRVPS